ncbi:MAG: hypothetical protein WCS84_08230, partial [Nocardioides sp.]
MAALTKDVNRPLYEGDNRVNDVAATVEIFKGGLISWNNSDGLRPFLVANTSDKIVGIAQEHKDNSAGLAGALTCEYRSGVAAWIPNDTTDPVTAAMIGKWAYGFNDNTVRAYNVAKSNIPVGIIRDFNATTDEVFVEH